MMQNEILQYKSILQENNMTLIPAFQKLSDLREPQTFI